MPQSATATLRRSSARHNNVATIQDELRALRADYQIGQQNRFRRDRQGVNATGRAADWHFRNESRYIRGNELARDIDRNDMIIGQGVDRFCDLLLQDTGIQPDPDTGDASIDNDLLGRWQEWSEDPEQCDVAGEECFTGLERLALRDSVVVGDILGIMPEKRIQLQLIENHRLRTPNRTRRNVVLGILLNELRRRLEYWITPDDINPLSGAVRVSDVSKIRTRDAAGNRQVLHVYDPKRVSQTRGITAMNPIVDVAGQHDDLQFAKLVQAQIVSCFAILEERDENYQGSGQGVSTGPTTSETVGGTFAKVLQGISPGLHIKGEPNSSLSGFSPNVPNPEHFEHSLLLLSIIAINLKMPVVVLLLDPRQTNFSGWRGALDQAKLGWRYTQKWFTKKFHRPIWRWKVRQWMAEDETLGRASVSGGIDIFRCKWNAPTWPYIEPLKDASADLMRLRNCLTSWRRYSAQRGFGDWNTLRTEIIEDNAAAISDAYEKAEELNSQFPDLGVHWREILCLPTPDGLQVNLSGAMEEPAAAPQGTEE